MCASVNPGICVRLYVRSCERGYPAFVGMRETFQVLVDIRQDATAKSNRPQLKKERADFSICRGNTGSQQNLRENSFLTSLTFTGVNAVSEDEAI